MQVQMGSIILQKTQAIQKSMLSASTIPEKQTLVRLKMLKRITVAEYDHIYSDQSHELRPLQAP